MAVIKKDAPYRIKTYQDFSGGWNADSAPDSLADNECSTFENVDTAGKKGAIKQRAGCSKLNSAAFSDECTLITEWNRKDGSVEYLGMVGNNLVKFHATTWAPTTIKALGDPNIGYFFFQDSFYFTGKDTDNLDKFWKYGGRAQVESLTIAGTTTAEGSARVTVTGVDITDSPFAVQVPVPNSASSSDVATRVRTYLNYFSEITKKYVVGGSGSNVTLTALDSSTNDDTLNMAIINGGGTNQVDSITVKGVITVAGNVRFTMSSSKLPDTSDLYVAVLVGDDASAVATKIKAAVDADSDITTAYTVSKSGAKISFTNKTKEATIDVSIIIRDATCDGMTTVQNSVDVHGSTDTAGLTEVSTSTDSIVGGEIVLTEVTPDTDSTCDLSPIKKCRSFTWNPKNNRVFATGNPDDGSCLYYSEANEPNFFKATSRVYPTEGEGDALGVYSFSTGVIVEFYNALWSWTGYDPATDAVWGKLPITHGAISAGSVSLTPNSLTMVGVGGLYALNPGALDKDIMMINSSEMSVNLSQNRVNSVLESASHISTMVSCYQSSKQKYLLAYGDDSENPKNNKILVYDFVLGCFAQYTNIQANYFCACDNGDILIASGTYILKMEQGLNDINITTGLEVPVPLKITTKGVDLDNPYYLKKVRNTLLAACQFKDSDTTLNMGLSSGYQALSYLNVLMDESLAWGDEWGRIWGWTDIIIKQFKTRMKGSRFQLTITHSVIDEDLLVYGFALEYKLKKAKGVKYNGTASKNILS